MLKLTSRPNRLWVVGIVVGLAGIILAAPGARPKAPPAAKAKAPPAAKVAATAPAATKPAAAKPFTVKRSDFRITISAKGTFDAAGATEIRVTPKAWTPRAGMKVLVAARRGSMVKKGQLLLKLDTHDIDEAIQDAQLNQQAAELTLKVAQQDFAAKTKTHKLDLAAAERSKKEADEDYQRYLKIDRPLTIKTTNRSLTSAERSLSYVREELRQLEKMYKADDLTEETEEIILKRQRYAVDRAEFSLEVRKLSIDKTLKIDIPRQDIVAREGHERQRISHAKSRITMTASLQKARLELAKLKIATARSAKKLTELKADRAILSVTSPAAGMVIHGGSAKGAWPKLGRELEADDKIQPDDVAMTVITPGKVIVRTKVPEAEVHRLRAGMACELVPAAFPKSKLKGKVSYVDPLPAAGNVAMTLTVTTPKAAPRLLPAMNCKVTLLVYTRANALTVPAGLVHAGEKDAKKKFVYVHGGGGTSKRAVTVGRTGSGKTEILRGLKEGEVVVPGPAKCK